MAKIVQWLIKVKLLKTKNKETNLKLARGRKWGIKNRGELFIRNKGGHKMVKTHLKGRKKNLSTQKSLPVENNV